MLESIYIILKCVFGLIHIVIIIFSFKPHDANLLFFVNIITKNVSHRERVSEGKPNELAS